MFLKNRKPSYLAACVLMSALLGACSSKGSVTNRNPQLVAAPDKVSMLLADAADRASVAVETLAAVEQARSPGIAVSPVVNAPPELRRALTMNWVGPVEPVTKELANRASYSFNVIGTPPAVPVVVSIDVENKPVIDILRNVGLQLGMRADVRVDATRRVVEIHYAPATGVGG